LLALTEVAHLLRSRMFGIDRNAEAGFAVPVAEVECDPISLVSRYCLAAIRCAGTVQHQQPVEIDISVSDQLGLATYRRLKKV
jgi:hypothetical protein